MSSFVTTVAVGCMVAALAGCGEADTAVGSPAEHSYDGPLHVSRGQARHPEAGAAGDVVDCTTWGSGGTSGAAVYGNGATAGTPTKALEVARSERIFGGVQDGLRVAKEEERRVLYVLEVGGVVKQAVIVHDGPATEGAGGDGWYVESWAHCDYAELPRTFTDSIGLQVWSDREGRAVPTTTVESWTGPVHCAWQSMTFLELGKSTYVRRPRPELADYFTDPYRAHADLPADALDTGFERNGQHLWLSADERRAFVGTDDDVEVWPRTVQPLGCD
jgi:hypothetical protein